MSCYDSYRKCSWASSNVRGTSQGQFTQYYWHKSMKFNIQSRNQVDRPTGQTVWIGTKESLLAVWTCTSQTCLLALHSLPGKAASASELPAGAAATGEDAQVLDQRLHMPSATLTVSGWKTDLSFIITRDVLFSWNVVQLCLCT